MASLHHDSEEKKEARIETDKAKSKAEGDMKALQAKVDAANQAQVNNTKLYVDSFQKMSGQIGDLKSEVKTEGLQKKLSAVQAELQKTQKAMAPGPKAELTFSFAPFQNGPPPSPAVPNKEVTAKLNSESVIHVQCSILNNSEVDALDVTINLFICDQCRFAKEPSEFTKLQGMSENIRYVHQPVLHAHEFVRQIDLDIIPPAGVSQMQVGFNYRCNTCTVHLGLTPETSGTIQIERP